MTDELTVKALPTDKSDLPQTEYMKKKIISKFPSMTLNIGRSGSGKSTVVAHMMSDKKMYGSFFHTIHLFSPTGDQDDLVKHLKIPKRNIHTKPSEEDLINIIEKQNKLIKSRGIEWTGKNSRVLIIFDDIVANKKFLSGEGMLKVATMGRHSLISSIVNTQSYTKIPRAIRLQANAVILFPSSLSEVERVVEDHCPPHKPKKQFRHLVETATTGKHNFLYIMCPEPAETRFRKCFHSYLRME
jgi:hypothetical protein